MSCPEPDAVYVVWVIDSQGRIGLFVGNNPINSVDPLGLEDPKFYQLRIESKPGDYFYPGRNPGEGFWAFALRTTLNTLANPSFQNAMAIGGPGSNFGGALNQNLRIKCPPAKSIAAPKDSFVTLYRQGNPNTIYQSSKPVSTSLSPELTHYDPSAQLLQFKVPQQTFDQWRLQGNVEQFNDLHLPTGIITSETRILPPASGQLNQFLVKPE